MEQKNEAPSRNAKKDEMISPPDAAIPKCNDDVYLELSLHCSFGTHTSWWIYKHSVSLFGMMIQAANSRMSPPEKIKMLPVKNLIQSHTLHQSNVPTQEFIKSLLFFINLKKTDCSSFHHTQRERVYNFKQIRV